MTTQRLLLTAGLLSAAFGLTACPSDPAPTDAPTPSDTPGADTPGGITNDCAGYCTQTMANCTGANAQYDDMAECLAFCAAVAWDAGTEGDTTGNTLACRIYHGGVAADMPAVHCPHAGPTGGAVCGAAIDFRTDLASAYTRVDRMGMPAVATALVPSDARNAYNDGDPTDDAALTFATAALTTLGAIHTGLDDDLTASGLTPCSMTSMTDVDGAGPLPPLPDCVAQPVAAGGPPVVTLVVPDTLQIDPGSPSGFPNGRELDDPVIDVTLAVILLDLESATGCAGGPCTAGTIAGLPLNPGENDEAFLTEFPYLAAAHAP